VSARGSAFRLLALGALFAVAVGIRLFGIADTPLDFHPTKQYRSAITTRAFYFQNEPTVEEWRRQVAEDSLLRIGIIVPTPQELVIARLYSMTGGERVWYGRLFSSLCWLLGGVFLFRLARRIASFEASLLGVAFYLLLPFAVLASQSFQPDAPMVGALVASLLLVVRYHERPGTARFVLAAASSALAVFLKPISIFFVFPAFVGAALGLGGGRGRLRAVEMIGFLVVSFAPSLAFYLYRIVGPGFADWQRETSFVPSFMLEFRFWDGWLKRVRLAIGFTYFIGGLVGALVARQGMGRSLLLSLWVGYAAMCLSCTYKISTHDYYHLPLVPVIALSLTQLVEAIHARLDQGSRAWLWRVAVGLTVSIGLLLAAGTSVQARRRVPDFSPDIALAKRVGTVVNHSTATIFLAPYYGRPMMYYGELSGEPWPYWYDVRDEALWNPSVPSAEERLAQMAGRTRAEYFVVLDLEELARQSDLARCLETYPVISRDDDLLVYDLRGPRSDRERVPEGPSTYLRP
jgi:hypothetical protein